MTHAELAAGVAFMTTRWGPQKRWERWEELHTEYATYTAGALFETLHSWFRAGNKFAPTPSELRHAISDTQRRRIDSGTDTLTVARCTTHTYAAPDPWDEARRSVCVHCAHAGPVWVHEHRIGKNGRCIYCPAASRPPQPVETELF